MNFSIGEIAIIWHPKSSQSGYDMSAFHGVECEIHSYASGRFKDQLYCDYAVTTTNSMMIFYVKESELRKKPQDEDDASHYDGTEVSSWDAEGTVWKPEKELTEA